MVEEKNRSNSIEFDSKDAYIHFLENRIAELSKNTNYSHNDLEGLLRIQNDQIMQRYGDREWLIDKNKSLTKQINNLQRTLELSNSYIHFLINSRWWKLTLPLRVVSRRRKEKKYRKKDYNYQFHYESVKKDCIDEKVLILISTYNAGSDFFMQLETLQKQKKVKNYEIVVIDRGSVDNTVKIAEERNVKVIDLFHLHNLDSYFENVLIKDAKYVVYLEQNVIISGDDWIYKSIISIENHYASSVVIFDKKYVDYIESIKNESYFSELKERFRFIYDSYFLFLPINRDDIQYLNPFILDKSNVVIKKVEDS